MKEILSWILALLLVVGAGVGIVAGVCGAHRERQRGATPCVHGPVTLVAAG